ncbi:GntR family transcriptional regulator [Corynebacterium uberis]|uniref:GntR family transcriptional regulator n=1 Tax=Corynebacterium TaxID=1716 RepID=UPI001D0BB8EE|nr:MULTISPECIES: GntR family transcriptional regulator [Corynebacterium]MCZ9309277.1 GntR family transcriptional regulator [Corynebacterium sp. c6VSa_13]UDL72832.1 GntR family transcriptional regulator [Corynebacterium uberis]UDL76290.1 GntR family transcriptional regulator [Corynebacterium uberis]UDL78503.1 GntR family transcriptional regulator [Corynebacterium uberis]UDL80784.1 GntR family transcriptional regulator [Corynebacterium uberis]
MASDPRPIYIQIAAGIADQIAAGLLGPGDKVPSTNELSAFHSVNPNTAARALNQLAEDGLVEKRRGIGMFVLPTARDTVLKQRRTTLAADFIRPLLNEAAALGLSPEELSMLIDEERHREQS